MRGGSPTFTSVYTITLPRPFASFAGRSNRSWLFASSCVTFQGSSANRNGAGAFACTSRRISSQRSLYKARYNRNVPSPYFSNIANSRARSGVRSNDSSLLFSLCTETAELVGVAACCWELPLLELSQRAAPPRATCRDEEHNRRIIFFFRIHNSCPQFFWWRLLVGFQVTSSNSPKYVCNDLEHKFASFSRLAKKNLVVYEVTIIVPPLSFNFRCTCFSGLFCLSFFLLQLEPTGCSNIKVLGVLLVIALILVVIAILGGYTARLRLSQFPRNRPHRACTWSFQVVLV